MANQEQPWLRDRIYKTGDLAYLDDQGNYVCRSTDLKVNSLKVHILNGKCMLYFLVILFTNYFKQYGKISEQPVTYSKLGCLYKIHTVISR